MTFVEWWDKKADSLLLKGQSVFQIAQWAWVAGRESAQLSYKTGSPKLLLRCRDYIAGVSGRSIKGDELLNELNEQLRAGTPSRCLQ